MDIPLMLPVFNVFVGSIDLTLSLGPDSAFLQTDASGQIVGLTVADITPFLLSGLPSGITGSSFTNSNLNQALGCEPTFFTAGCGGPPYDFAFSNFFPSNNFTLAAGNSVTNLFGAFTPTGGAAPAGTYTQQFTEVFIQVWDDNPADSQSGPIHLADIPIADTSNGASFTRTVENPTPEPGTWVLMLTGLALACGAAHRKSKTAAA